MKWAKIIWNADIPPSTSFIVWRLIRTKNAYKWELTY